MVWSTYKYLSSFHSEYFLKLTTEFSMSVLAVMSNHTDSKRC